MLTAIFLIAAVGTVELAIAAHLARHAGSSTSAVDGVGWAVAARQFVLQVGAVGDAIADSHALPDGLQFRHAGRPMATRLHRRLLRVSLAIEVRTEANWNSGQTAVGERLTVRAADESRLDANLVVLDVQRELAWRLQQVAEEVVSLQEALAIDDLPERDQIFLDFLATLMAQQVRIRGHVVTDLPAEFELDGLAGTWRKDFNFLGRQIDVVNVAITVDVRWRRREDVVKLSEVDFLQLKVVQIHFEILEEPRAGGRRRRRLKLADEEIPQILRAGEELLGFGVEVEQKVDNQIFVAATLVKNATIER